MPDLSPDEIELTQRIVELEGVIGGLDAGRRVGWAKYFDATDELVMTRARFAFGLGVALRVGERIRKSAHGSDRRRRSIAAELVDEIIEETLGTWPGDYTAVTLGIDHADEFVSERWGDWGRAIESAEHEVRLYEHTHPDEAARRRRMEGRRPKQSDGVESRCVTCTRLLAMWRADGSVDIRCRCGTHNVLGAEEQSA